jgi:ABC-type branched-subunit amino acid transport system permease subunit
MPDDAKAALKIVSARVWEKAQPANGGRRPRSEEGAMLGGLLVGLVESWARGYLNGNVSDLVVFGVLIGVMLLRPSGLLGTPALQKV